MLSLQNKIESVVVSDSNAIFGCLEFLNDMKGLVEPACGAGLCIVYDKTLSEKYLNRYKNIIVVVCGGSAITPELLLHWKSKFGL